VKVVFIFSSKTSILIWCGLKQAENEPKTTHVSDPGLSLGENRRFRKRSYSACFQAENDPYINSGTGCLYGFRIPDPDFYSSPIPVLGPWIKKQQQKTCFVATKITKFKIILFLNR
jgi:hypothetical protein